jgi:hypothetical protein
MENIYIQREKMRESRGRKKLGTRKVGIVKQGQGD